MKVSVILTSYNHEKFLRESIESVLNQTFSDFELIIVDDHSTDNSWDIIKDYKDDRIVAIQNEINLRSKGFHNAIRNVAKGQYIAIHHSDDVWQLEKLEKQVKFLDENINYAACFSRVDFIDELSNKYELPEGHIYKDIFNQPNRTREEWLRFFFYYGNCLCHPSVLIRREMYDKCKMLDMYGLAQLPDFYKWIKLCLKENIFIIPEKLIKFRIKRTADENTSADKPEVHIRSQIELFYLLKEFRSIKDVTMFLKIFPDAEKYYTKDGISLDFALAKMCLETNSQPHQLLGIIILFELVNNNETSLEIENMYGYTQLNLISDTARYDIFAISRIFNYINSSIFLDFGYGFNEKDKITKLIYIKGSGDFNIKYNLCSIKNEREIYKIRFDIDEGKLWKCHLKEIYINGKLTNAEPLNSEFKQGDYNVFFTIDPIYNINNVLSDITTIEINGNVQRVTDVDISQYLIGQVMNEQEKEFDNKVYIKKLLDEVDFKSQLLSTNEKDIENYIKKTKEQEKEIENNIHEIHKKNNEIEKINSILKEKYEEIENINMFLQDKDIEIENFKMLILEKDKEINSFESQLLKKTEYLAEIESTFLGKLMSKIINHKYK